MEEDIPTMLPPLSFPKNQEGVWLDHVPVVNDAAMKKDPDPPQTPSPAVRRSRFPSSLFIGVTVLLGLAVNHVFRQQPNTSVLRMKWEDNESNPQHMAQWLAASDVPVVLSNTPFDSWHSYNWTPSSLSPQVPLVLSKKGPENVFQYFAMEQPLSAVQEFNEKKPYAEIVYSGEKLFKLLQGDFDGSYYYASGGFELLELKEMYSELSLKKLTFPTHTKSLGQVNFWFGRANVTAYTHYDTSYNLHAMVHGKKKFLLFPPSAYSELGLYPCLHQFYRQVHLDVLNDTLVESLETKPVEVVLTPGEVLYIPPYWFHCVVTMEMGISLNVWSNSESYLTMEEVFASPIPFQEEWGRGVLLKALQYYIGLLVEGIIEEKNVSFVKAAVFMRYKPLLKRLDSETMQRMTALAGAEYCLKGSISKVLDESSVAHITTTARKLLRLFMDIRSPAVQEINLANYIEHVSWRIVGTEDVLLLPFYYQECF